MSKIREYFTFTRSERNGILVLLFIIIILLVSLQVIPLFFERTQVDYSSFEKEVDKFITSIESQKSDSNWTDDANSSDSLYQAEYFSFNPNTASEAQLLKLGLSKKVVKTWVNFRSKGGKFRKAEDVQKIWGLEDSTYQKIKPYLVFEKNNSNQNNWEKKPNEWSYKDNEKYVSVKKDNSVELNSADSSGLCALPGIGPGFSKRILKYRNSLGGFISKDQLLEVYGFTPEMYSKIEALVYVESMNLNKININKAEFKQFIRHPYFTKEMINKILEYKRIQTKISNIQDLVKDKMMTKEQADKITPYIEY